MLTLSRRTLHRFRSVARQALHLHRGPGPPVVLQPADGGLSLRVGCQQAAAELQLPADLRGRTVCVPFALLDDCQAPHDDPVTLSWEAGQVAAQWREAGGPQRVQYDLAEPPAEAYPPPATTAPNPPQLLRALADASTVTHPEPTRYALNCLQLDGDRGRIAASDGRQMLVQTGFTFPWQGAILLPACKLFRCPHLPRRGPVGIGQSDGWLTLSTGGWTFRFSLHADGRFPRVDDCLPQDHAVTSTLDLSEADAALLADHLRRLPLPEDFNRPITLDLNGEVVVRARGEDPPSVTELALVNSTRSGDAIRVATNRGLLARALALGFRQVRFTGPEQPAFCRDERRTFVWALLAGDGALAATQPNHRIESPQRATSPVGTPAKSNTRRSTPPMPQSETPTRRNGHQGTEPGAASEGQHGSPVEQAEALRDGLKDALDKTRELIRSLKRQQKTSRIVESTLASLRQLQTTDL